MLSGLVQNLGGLQFSKPQPCKTTNAVDEGNVKMYNSWKKALPICRCGSKLLFRLITLKQKRCEVGRWVLLANIGKIIFAKKTVFFYFRTWKKMIFSFKNPAKISTTSNNMGWRGDKLLLQGKVKTGEFFFLFFGDSSNSDQVTYG